MTPITQTWPKERIIGNGETQRAMKPIEVASIA